MGLGRTPLNKDAAPHPPGPSEYLMGLFLLPSIQKHNSDGLGPSPTSSASPLLYPHFPHTTSTSHPSHLWSCYQDTFQDCLRTASTLGPFEKGCDC